MKQEKRERYRELFGPSHREGHDASEFLTPFRWIRNKIFGTPLSRWERRKLEESLYPEMRVTKPPRLNLLSIKEKYE